MGQRGRRRGPMGAPIGRPVDAHRVREIPFRRSGRARVACAKQSNADVLQLDRVDDMGHDTATTEAAREARSRLAKLTEKDNSVKMFMKELRKVLEHADVLLEVLDVRDPLGCRAYAIEQEAQRLGKKVVLILNKIDLVPASNARAWLAYLRNEFPTLPFKASTQQQRHHLGQNQGVMWKKEKQGEELLAGGAEAVGTRAILQLIKNYSRNLNLKSSITVGTIGAPNVGKSSLINSLKRSRVCGVASTPGHTKVVQGIMLDRHIRLLDSPGIVFSDANAPPGATPEQIEAAAQAAMLRNVLKVELVEDPQEPVQAILHRIDPKYLAEVYNIPELPSRDVQDFLLRVAYQKGRLSRGALPDLDGTARSILHDWNTGKIQYQTEPPAKHPNLVRPNKHVDAAPADQGSAAILTSFSEEFDLAGLLGEADAEALGGDGRYSPPPAPVLAMAPDPVDAGVDDVTHSTLGKHDRDDSSSDDDEPTDRTRRPSAWGVLPVEGDEEDEDEEPVPATLKPPTKPTPKPLFTEAESEAMAPLRGKARRKARKEKKRRQGLAQTMDTLMDLDAGADPAEAAPPSEDEEEW
ncbi:nuclear GTP-binding protein nug1 [Malassezia nana]|uniref:Nuclear GTP-binding protein nug1 n=1 Tax=Malassezia nana TaxID=180528 RepID=A0AAF0J358_9BASI|nr:nuclear GTP-binding protein nug1 [Malassezia nana]